MIGEFVEQSSFGPYQLVDLLGRGGMGEVYRAHDTATDRTVALKVLPAKLADDPEYVARFRRECRLAARLNEAHVVPIHGFGEIDGRLYLDMRLVNGIDLAAWLTAHGPLAPAAAAVVVGQVAQALDAAHSDDLVHRDVKPSNILLADVTAPPLDVANLFVYLFDFGIARPRDGVAGPDGMVLTRAGAVSGSPSYLAPERFSGVDSDSAADVYALACVLFETLAGAPPFTGSLPALIRAHVYDPPPRPSALVRGVPTAFDEIVARGMAKDPAQRYPTAGALAVAVRGAVGTELEELRTIRSGGTIPAAGTVAQPAPTGVPSDLVTVRFGPGVTASSPAPAPPSTTLRPAARSSRSAASARSRRSGLGQVLRGGIVTGLVVAGILAYLFLRQQTPLEVVGATVAPAADPGRACDLTVDVVGTIQTNGLPGTITYQWARSDGEGTEQLTESIAAGTTSADVHLLWTLSGRGRYPATATLRIMEPNPVESAGSFTYDCR